ncbi:MAG: phage portal protein [Patescibacteria group bacterium]
MNFIDRLRIAFSNNFNERIAQFYKGEDDLGSAKMGGTPEAALKYAAVFACVRVLSETMATFPIGIFKRSKDGSKQPRSDISLYKVLHDAPNPEMTPYNFKETMMMSLNLGGNAYAQIIRNSAGEIIGLYPLDWQKVEVIRNPDNTIGYKIENGNSGQFTVKSRNEIFHIPGLSLNGINGLTPISYAEKAIELGLTYEAFGVNFYRNGANTSLVVTHPRTLSKIAKENLEDSLRKRNVGIANTGQLLIFEEGVTAKEMTIKPVDAQMIESKNFSLEDICRIYRVPQHLINKLDRSTFNNIEVQSTEFIIYTMLPWVMKWEENFSLQLFTPDQKKSGYFAEFKIDGLLRGDTISRYQAYSMGRQWGWLSVNDIRKLENMNPIDNGDIYLEPANMKEAGEDDKPAPEPPNPPAFPPAKVPESAPEQPETTEQKEQDQG